MKITILGAGGARTPLLVNALARRHAQIGLTDLALMDVDEERLEIISALVEAAAEPEGLPFKVSRTPDGPTALRGADFVLTTFRVGGTAARIVDERVPLALGVLGQETTGPGGFAMAMRTIPVLLGYIEQMRTACPGAWLINFANPAGLLAEAAVRLGRWEHTVGICDAPEGMALVAAALLRIPVTELFLDYFGLNHLGWVRGVIHGGQDHLPAFLETGLRAGGLPGLPFDASFVAQLGLIPNEYLYYYYHNRESLACIERAGRTRGEQIAAESGALFQELEECRRAGDGPGMIRAHRSFLDRRSRSYMIKETGRGHGVGTLGPEQIQAVTGEGYAGIALNAIAALVGSETRVMILNVPNRGALRGMDDDAVVEVPAVVGRSLVRPLAAAPLPAGPLGLMQQVKTYEQLTIAAAAEGSYAKALEALAIHPLVRDLGVAQAILDGYVQRHGALFPGLG